jgi:hypothetical protein
MINKGLMTNLGVEIPYDTVREGTWTLDKMIALTENTYEDTDGNGRKTDDDRIGLCTGVETLYCLQESLDLSAYSKQDDGTIALNFDIERMDSALSKLRTLYGTQDFTYKTNSAFTSEIFKTGTAMMVLGQIADAYDIYRECDFNYGFLPCPKYDELQENYVSGCTDLPWAIPKTITEEQTDIIGTVVEAISCYNYKNVLPVYFESAMKSRIADSPDDADMLQLLLCEVDEGLIVHIPHLVTLVAEVLETDPNGVLGILHHIGGPVVENLNTPQTNVPILHVHPAIGNDIV